MSAKLHWQPSEEFIRNSGLEAFRQFVNSEHGTDFKFGEYWPLYEWSTSSDVNIDAFWTALWKFSGCIGDLGDAPVSEIRMRVDPS